MAIVDHRRSAIGIRAAQDEIPWAGLGQGVGATEISVQGDRAAATAISGKGGGQNDIIGDYKSTGTDLLQLG